MKKQKDKVKGFHEELKNSLDDEVKKRLAEFFLDLINETPLTENYIQKTAYNITGFIQYNFDDGLDEIVSLAGELELPEEHVSGDVKKMFIKMKKLLEDYLYPSKKTI